MIQNSRLLEFRKSQNKTQEDMAGFLEVSTSFYQKIENGERNPSFNFITKFKRVFPQANTDYIFFNQSNHETCSNLNATGTDGK